MKKVYLILAVVGAIVPYIFFANFIQLYGFDLPKFVELAFGNAAAGGFSADLCIATLLFWVFLFHQQRKGGPKPWLFIILTLTIGLTCALGVYLYVREKCEPK